MSSSIATSEKNKKGKLDTSVLTNFKTRGVNISQIEINAAVKEHNENKKYNKNLNSSSSVNNKETNTPIKPEKIEKEPALNEMDLLRRKIQEIEQKARLAELKINLSANELKLFEAIQEESKATGNNTPPMSLPYITTKYGINKKYLGDAIKGLIEKSVLRRTVTKFNGQKSFAWEILKN